MHTYTCDKICDNIANGEMTLEDAIDAFSTALGDDPTESFHAAHIRDAIRENFDDTDACDAIGTHALTADLVHPTHDT